MSLSLWRRQALADGQVKVNRVDTLLAAADSGTKLLELCYGKGWLGWLDRIDGDGIRSGGESVPSDLAGRFVTSGNTKAPSGSGVDTDALMTE